VCISSFGQAFGREKFREQRTIRGNEPPIFREKKSGPNLLLVPTPKSREKVRNRKNVRERMKGGRSEREQERGFVGFSRGEE